VLIAIASSIFQSIAQNNKKQKQNQPKPVVQYNKPVMQQPQAVKQAKPPVQNKPKAAAPKKTVKPSTEGVGEEAAFRGSMNSYSSEGMQTEAAGNQRSMDVPKVTTDHGLQPLITFDDLQRSIVMAEVLGKPKALRRGTR